MQSARIACLTALLFTIVGPVPTLAANPLSAAERQVCRNLSHCLSILDEHPHDSFDYAVLAEEFARFGAKGRDRLIRRVGKGAKADERVAGHAADLLAMSMDSSALPLLRALAARETGAVRDLAIRTHDALSARLHPNPDSASDLPVAKPSADLASACQPASQAGFAANKKGMPYFEMNVAAPDASGAYRPSAAFQIDRPLSTRANLRAAVSVAGGWYAAYPDSLVHYDSRTGAPIVRFSGCILTVQRRSDDLNIRHVWAIAADDDMTIRVMEVGPDSLRDVARLARGINGLTRQADGRLCLRDDKGTVLALHPDGSVDADCQAEAMR